MQANRLICGSAAIALAFMIWSAEARGQLVISQIFGGSGGNASAANGDFVEIFNRSCVAVPLSQYRVQVTNNSTNPPPVWSSVTLPNVALDPGQYFCIRLNTTTIGTAFTADLNATTVGDVLLPSGGKAAITLVAQSPIENGTVCPLQADVVDFVMYAATAGICTEGNRFFPSNSATTGRGYQRKLNGCQDTNDNLNDFVSDVNPAMPRTSTSGFNVCVPQNVYGACNLANGSCRAVVNAAACTALGGVYQGNCVQCVFPEACCMPTLPVTCQLLTPAQCAQQGGINSAGQLSCPPTPACQSPGRCCSPNGTCTITHDVFCTAPNVFGGSGSNCNGTPCSGRCCAPNGDCSVTGPINCFGQFAGLGTSCIASYDLITIPIDFTDITGSGSLVTGADNTDDGTSTSPIPIGFTFNFFGNDYTSVTINNNGIFTFGPIGAITTYQNVPLPANAANAPNNAVYPLWDDLDCRRAIYPNAFLQTETQGPPGSQVFIVQWTSVVQYNGGVASSDVNTFQAKLFEVTNRIEFHYLTVGPEVTPDTFPGTVIGIENADGSAWVQFESMATCRDALGGGNTALRFAPATPCEPTGGCTCYGDLNGDGAVNGKDIRGFSTCLISGGGGCDCADMDHSGAANVADMSLFVTRVLSGSCGP